MSTTLIHSGTLVCMDAAGTIARGDLLVRDAVIAAVGAAARADPAGAAPDQSIDATDCFVMPGLVQGHVHLCQTLLRGLAEDVDLLRWLRERIWPLEAAHTEASIAASARLGLAEMISGGVTTVNDMGTVRHTDRIGEVLGESGIRAVFGGALMDRGDDVPPALRQGTRAALDGALALASRFHGTAGGRLRVSLAPRFILSCSDALWRDVRDASSDRDLVVHTHVSESRDETGEVDELTGTTATQYLSGHGVLGPRFVGAHGVWLGNEELALLGRAGAALVHCPGSNLKLGSGFARVRAWKRAAMRCGLGSDGAACNNRLDAFREMSLAASLSRALEGSAALSSRETLELATCGGAAALGLGDVTGSLEVGKQADVILLDHGAIHSGPQSEADRYATIVHAARSTDVRLTMVAGRVLYRDGAWSTLDAERVGAEARIEALGLVRRAEIGAVR